MSHRQLRTVLVGLGMIGAQYGEDAKTQAHYRFATHADVLETHPEFEWVGAADLNMDSVARGQRRWPNLFISDKIEELAELQPDVVVLATGPSGRIELLDHFSRLRGVVCEKPLGTSVDEGLAFVDYCQVRNVGLQVNLWRRADRLMRQLRNGLLARTIGKVQNMSCRYGRGIRNNGLHCIDLFRMLVGEIESVQALGKSSPAASAGLIADADVSFVAQSVDGVLGTFHPIDFEQYRDLAFDFWGEEGRLVIDQEGLRTTYFPRADHRAISAGFEVAHDQGQQFATTAGTAFFEVYSDLAQSIHRQSQPVASGHTALQSQRVVEAAITSLHSGGNRIGLESWPLHQRRIAS